ncbi:hypothetical protein [Cyclobacterium plantarum]|uniref:hypothetical protein n=1 Tax=Cyclobacterium plantarum TaxID=2716263 RepID=UPI003F6F67C5
MEKNTISFYSTLLLSTCILFSACNLSDLVEDTLEENEPQEGDHFVKATVNGADFMALVPKGKDIQVDLVEAEYKTSSLGFSLIISAADVLISSQRGVLMQIHLMGPDLTGVQVGTRFETMNEENLISDSFRAFAVISKGQLEEFEEYEAGTVEQGSINVEITAYEPEERLISGKFSFEAYDEEADITVKVINGEFRNITW